MYSLFDALFTSSNNKLSVFLITNFICRWSPAAATAAKSLQSCLTLCDPMDCSLPGSSVHGIFQARVLEWVVIAFSDHLLALYIHNHSYLNNSSYLSVSFFLIYTLYSLKRTFTTTLLRLQNIILRNLAVYCISSVK